MAQPVRVRGLTEQEGIWSAGLPGGVGGAQLALAEGEIAAHALAGRPVPARPARTPTTMRAFAAPIAASPHPPLGWTAALRAGPALRPPAAVPARTAPQQASVRAKDVDKLLKVRGAGLGGGAAYGARTGGARTRAHPRA
ncbi:hypothetical protein [Streptomyces sp. ICC1]|uniref:hypothetical protein n=1 Tax=Streptomyces sp. ICC1 TaxID=2099583 RepID=UPI000DC7804D|nr:hypothetical protein [Streptomyces sp. ICC1]AWZ14090.1 hypothetical protein DRB96_19460 [Streptomyces sp. ICC1]